MLKSDQDGLELVITTPKESKAVRVIGGKGTNNALPLWKKWSNEGEKYLILDSTLDQGIKMSDEEYTRKIVEMEAEKSGILPASPRINVKPTGRVSADFYTPRSNPYNSTKKPPE